MNLYDIIYQWFAQYIWVTTETLPTYDVGGVTMGTCSWLAHTSTIIVLVALCLFLFWFVRFIWRAFSGLWGR